MTLQICEHAALDERRRFARAIPARAVRDADQEAENRTECDAACEEPIVLRYVCGSVVRHYAEGETDRGTGSAQAERDARDVQALDARGKDRYRGATHPRPVSGVRGARKSNSGGSQITPRVGPAIPASSSRRCGTDQLARQRPFASQRGDTSEAGRLRVRCSSLLPARACGAPRTRRG